MLKYLQLPFQFDAQLMQKEVNSLSETFWKEHYNKKHYTGDWSILPLQTPGGNANNIFAVPINSPSLIHMPYKSTPLLDACPYITSLLNSLECEKTMVRLMKLNAGAVIKEHTDYDMCFEAGEARLHIPVQTNEQVEFYVEEERVMMHEGSCWYLNLNLPHRVNNFGKTDRIHLVVDCVVNDWLKELLLKKTIAERKMNFEKSVSFLESLGIKIVFRKTETGFLPGTSIHEGMIIVDVEKMLHPGDILHEAGHIAVVPAMERASLNDRSIPEREHRGAEEMMAIAWSYAACIHLDIDPSFVFHGDGYNGGGDYIIENFREKKFFGLPMLQWLGMTDCGLYPSMIKWLRD